jgi:hypothetical protein
VELPSEIEGKPIVSIGIYAYSSNPKDIKVFNNRTTASDVIIELILLDTF